MDFDKIGGPATKLRLPNMPSEYECAFTSDIHVGGIAFDDKAYQDMLDWVLGDENRYLFNLGDNIIGSHPFHPYYEHLTVPVHEKFDLNTVKGQADAFVAINEEVAREGRLLQIIEGNHDWRFRTILPVGAYISQQLSVPYCGVSSLITLQHTKGVRDLDFFLAHEGPRLPKGAKDIRQRMANQEAALQRGMEFHFDSADFLAYGHTHQLQVTGPPGGKFPVRVRDKAGKFHEVEVEWSDFGPMKLARKGLKYVHPYAKWYANTGTFERTGVTVDVTDMAPDQFEKVPATYSQRANWQPTRVGYVRLKVKEGKIVDGYTIKAGSGVRVD